MSRHWRIRRQLAIACLQKTISVEVSNVSANYGDMGYITNNPTAGQPDDGSWVTLMTSGHYAGTGKMWACM